MLKKYTNIIFLDIDGVLNCELHYKEQKIKNLTWDDNIPIWKQVKKQLKKLVKRKEISYNEYYKTQLSPYRIQLLNELCESTDSVVVITSTWRLGRTLDEITQILRDSGATFTIIDKTPFTQFERGTEISLWLRTNITIEEHGCQYFDFYRYAIIDDDSDMLLDQAHHFFQTDKYCGLNYVICNRINNFFTHKTF